MGWIRRIGMAVLGVMLSAQLAAAQTNGWDVSIYPVLAWIPLGIDIGIDVPPFEGGGGGSGDIIDGRFDGAFLGGLSVQKDKVRFDGDVLWAAVGGDRLERPIFSVDADIIYGHGAVGYMFAKDLYATVGVRRIAFNFDVKFADQANFERKPGVWDPVLGVAWHKKGGFVDLHATFEGGGFGVGSDVEWAGGFRFDLKPVRYFGVTAGYNFLYFKVTDEALGRPFKFEQTLHGPVLGIGFYF